MNILLVDNYDSFTYNLYQLVQSLTDSNVVVHRNDQLSLADVLELQPSHIILSPGPGHPANDKDFGVCKDIIVNHQQLKVPTLGVCLGHQGIVQHLGGKVIQAKQIVHGKMSEISQTTKSVIFESLPQQFQAMRYHSLIACEETLPEHLEITARTAAGGEIMAIQHKQLPLFGVQFHPESIGTPAGKTILRNFIELC